MHNLPILCNMGIKKTLLCVGGLFLAAGGPVTVFSTSDLLGGVKRNWFAQPAATASMTSETSETSAAPLPSSSPLPPVAALPMAPTTADAMPTPSLAEVLRFDVSVEWIMHRWPRVSTGLPYLQLQGYRVPLVTGAGMTDVAGSLTYYFNVRQQVQRITFRGTTGDPRALVQLATQRFRLIRRLTNDPGLVLYESVDSLNRPVGSLKIRSAQVVRASEPYKRYEIDMAIDRSEE